MCCGWKSRTQAALGCAGEERQMESSERVTDLHLREQLVPIALTTATTKTPLGRVLTEKDFLAEPRRMRQLGPDGKPRYFCRIFLSGWGPLKGRHIGDSELYSDPKDAVVACRSIIDHWMRKPVSVLIGDLAARPKV